MKIKSIGLIIAATAMLSVSANAVSVALAGIANASAGLITLDGVNASGRAIFVSTTGSDVTDNAFASFSFATLTPLALNPLTSAAFDTALSSLIGTTSAGSPGIVRIVTFTDGVLASNAAQEMGDVGNSTHLFLVSESGGDVSGLGVYTGPAVPTLGAVAFSATTANDGIGIGTSTSGFQLVGVVPEPSAALLGALGALGLLRRRRA